MKFRVWKVDWPNHLIGFFSALFGILIAFELDQWREAKNNQDDAGNAFEKIKQEIEINKVALHETVNVNLQLLHLLEEELLPGINEKLQFKGSLEAARNINTKVNKIAMINLADTTLSKAVFSITVNIGSLLHPTLHYSAWESAKATGVINYIEYEKVLTISYLYNIPRITEELQEIRGLIRKSDDITTKSKLQKFISELKESHFLIQTELSNYDTFVSIIQGME